MNEERLKTGLKKIAAQHITDESDVWPKVQAGLSQPQERSVPKRLIPRWGMAVAAVLVMGVIAGMVPSVRARLVDLAETIGGVDFTFSADYPGSGQKVSIVPCEDIPIENLDGILAFTIPSSAPDGYVLEDEAMVCYFSSSDDPNVELAWRAEEGNIRLSVHSDGWLIGETEVETLTVEGHELAHWYGGWNYDTQQYDETIGQSLSWVQDDLTYTLNTLNSIPVNDLVEMAASTFE